MNVPNDPYTDKELLDFLGMQESQSIDWADKFTDQVTERLQNGQSIRGSKLPWSNTHELIRFRGGEVSIWAGMNGHKKSMLLGMIMMWFARNERVGVSSFEMPVIETMTRMISQAAGCIPSVDFGQKWTKWGFERMCFYDQLDTVPAERVLGSIFYMAKKLECKHILVDSLTKCGLASGDKDAEKRFIDTLSATAKALNIHIHLVSHVRKPNQGGESYIPNKFDIRGAGEITDLVDNVFIIWMDKKREAIKRKYDAGVSITDQESEYMGKNPDQRLICPKQRHGEWEGQIALWFDNNSLQFIPTDNYKVLFFDIQDEIL